MRFPIPPALALFAIVAAAVVTGCETHDRVRYHYEPAPVRIKQPRFVESPTKAETDVVAPGTNQPAPL